jgi:hypothetical protein
VNLERSAWIVLLVVGGCFAACDRTEDLVHTSADGQRGTRLAGTAVSARQVIDDCRQAYQKLSSYEDDGYVRLAYRMRGELLEDRAPLTVAFQRPGLLGIRAYSIEAGPQDGRWRLQLRDSGKSAVAGQVISRALPAKADFSWLLSDLAISEELAAGLAGFPPQLDMLLGPNPMRGLVDDSALLKLDPPETVGGELCHVVQVTRGPAQYRLWINQATMLLRRLQMPNAHLTPEMLADASITDTQLTIELPGIKTNEPIDWKKYAIPVSPEAKLVSHFVPAPPRMQVERLGMKVPAFRLRSSDGKQTFNSGETASDQITVLTWFADHPACKDTAVQLSKIVDAVAASSAANRVQFINVWAEPNAAAGSSFESLANDWRLKGKLVLDSEAVGRDLFGVSEAPTLVVIDGQNRLQIYEERSNPYLTQVLPGLLTRLADGEDLAGDVIRQVELDTQRFQAELWMAAAVDAQQSLFTPPTSYPPRVIAVTKSGEDIKFASDAQIVALTVDESQMIWTLTSNGLLQRIDPSTNVKQEFQTQWSIEANMPVRFEVSSDGKYLAFSQLNGHVVELFDTSIQQNRVVKMDAQEGVVDLQWMALVGSKSPRLAVVTSNKQTKLLDPNNHEQLSGSCPSTPLALIPQTNSDTSVGGYVVMEDRSIERLILSSDSTNATVLGRPAAYNEKKSETSKLPTVPAKVGFKPAAGPWKSLSTVGGTTILARGWIAQDEPAVILLNAQLQQHWHYRLPLTAERNSTLITTANIDPATGQSMWAISQGNRFVHILPGDGILMDHMQLDEPVHGLAMVPVGNRLVLYVAHPRSIATYSVGGKIQ